MTTMDGPVVVKLQLGLLSGAMPSALGEPADAPPRWLSSIVNDINSKQTSIRIVYDNLGRITREKLKNRRFGLGEGE